MVIESVVIKEGVIKEVAAKAKINIYDKHMHHATIDVHAQMIPPLSLL